MKTPESVPTVYTRETNACAHTHTHKKKRPQSSQTGFVSGIFLRSFKQNSHGRKSARLPPKMKGVQRAAGAAGTGGGRAQASRSEAGSQSELG